MNAITIKYKLDNYFTHTSLCQFFECKNTLDEYNYQFSSQKAFDHSLKKLFIPNKHTKLKPIKNDVTINETNTNKEKTPLIGNIDHNFYIKKLLKRISSVENNKNLLKSSFNTICNRNSNSSFQNTRYANSKLLSSIKKLITNSNEFDQLNSNEYNHISESLGQGVVVLYTILSIFYEKIIIYKSYFFNSLKNSKKKSTNMVVKKVFFLKNGKCNKVVQQNSIVEFMTNKLHPKLLTLLIIKMTSFNNKYKQIKYLQIKLKNFLSYIKNKKLICKRVKFVRKLKLILKSFYQTKREKIDKIILIQAKYRQM